MCARNYGVVIVTISGGCGGRTRKKTLAKALGVGVFLLAACGGSSDEGAVTVDAAEIKDAGVAGEPTPSEPDAGEDAPGKPPLACSSSVTAPTITLTYVAFMKLKPATGGTILDGHYVLTSGSTSSESASPRAAELWIRDGRYEYQKKAGPAKFSYGGKLTPEGTRFETTVDCGNQGSMPPFEYSVTGSELALQFTNVNGIRYLYRFERQ